jgi:hypothetical protein
MECAVHSNQYEMEQCNLDLLKVNQKSRMKNSRSTQGHLMTMSAIKVKVSWGSPVHPNVVIGK